MPHQPANLEFQRPKTGGKTEPHARRMWRKVLGWILVLGLALPGAATELAGLPTPPAGTAEIRIFSFPVEDMIYDSSRDRLLLSLGDAIGTNRNGIGVFSATNGLMEFVVPLGTRPKKMARSTDGELLYVSLPDFSVVRRFSTATLLPNLQFALGSETLFGTAYPWYAESMAVVPGRPNAVAVSRMRKAGAQAGESHRGVGIYENGVLRTNVTDTCNCNYALEFANATNLLAAQPSGTIDKLLVNEDGVVATARKTIGGGSTELSPGPGIMFTSGGRAFDDETLQYREAFAGADSGSAVLFEAASSRVFHIAGSGSVRQLLCFHATTGDRIGSLTLTNVVGTPSRLLRWSPDGLAFRTTGSQLFTIRSPLISGGPTPDLVVSQSRSLAAAATNQVVFFAVTITNAGAVRAAQVRVTNVLSGVSTVLAPSSTAGSCSVSGFTVACTLNDLEPNDGVMVTIPALRGTAGVMNSRASAIGSGFEFNVRNNTAWSATSVTSGGPDTLRILSLPVTDLAWDPARQRLLATGSSNLVHWRDSLLAIDPVGMAVTDVVPAGPDAGRIVNSSNRIYVGNYNDIRILDSASLAPLGGFNLQLSGGYFVAQPREIAVPADDSGPVAVIRRSDDIALFVQGVMRSNVVTVQGGNYRLAFGADNRDLYFQNDRGGGFSRLLADDSGLSTIYKTNLFTPFNGTPGDIRFSSGLCYNTYGGVIDLAGPSLLANLPDIPIGSWIALDESLRRVFYLMPAGSFWRLQAFELGTLLNAGSVTVPPFTGTPTSFLRWGSDGFAFSTTAGELCLLRTPLIATNPPANLGIAVTPSPPPHFVGTPLSLRLTITNLGPNEAQSVRWSNAVPAGFTLLGATTSQGNLITNAIAVVGQSARLEVGGSITVDLQLRSLTNGVFPIHAAVESTSVELELSNNVATAFFWLQSSNGASPVSILNVAARDLARDPIRDRLYLSIGKTGGTLANSILTLDPAQGAVLPPVSIGFDPSRIAVSPDGSYLYVALEGNGSVQRLNLATMQPDYSFPVPNLRRVIEMAVSPTNADLVVIYREFDAVISAHERGNPRPTELGGHVGLLAFSDVTSDLYTCHPGYSGVPLYRCDVGDGGVRVLDSQPGKQSVLKEMKFARGLLYYNRGMVVEPATKRIRAMLPIWFTSIVEPDADSGRVFYLTPDGSNGILRAFDNQQWLELGQEVIPGLTGQPSRLLRTGPRSLAFLASSNQVFIVQSRLIPTNPPTDLALSVRAGTNQLPLGSQLQLSLAITNRGLHPAAELVVTQGFSLSVSSLVASVSHGSVSNTPTSLIWRLPNLSTAEVATCSVTVQVSAAGTLTSRAAVRHAGNDPSIIDNLDVATVTVGATNSVRLFPLAASELVYDPLRDRIYASVPGEDPYLGNSVLALNPDTGAILQRWFVGSNPSQVALSADAHFLHAGLDGEMGAVRIDLESGQIDSRYAFSLTNLFQASDLEAHPARPMSVAAALRCEGCDVGDAIMVLDSGAARRLGVRSISGPPTIEFSPQGDLLYIINSQFLRYRVTDDGLTNFPYEPTILDRDDFKQDNGLLYFPSGRVVDPLAPILLYSHDPATLVVPDSKSGRVYYGAQSAGAWELRAYEIGSRQPAGTHPLTGIQGTPYSAIRSGADRMALLTSSSQLVLVRSSIFRPPTAPADLVVSQSVSQNFLPLPGNRVFFDLTVSNRGPSLVSAPIVTDLLPALAGGFEFDASAGSWTQSGNTLEWRPPALAVGDSAHLRISVLATNTLFYTNTVQAFPDKPELNWADNASTTFLYGVVPQEPDSTRGVKLSARSLAYDRARGRIFASLTDEAIGRQIVWFDAATAAMGGSIPVDGIADRFAVSDDSQYLYVTFLRTSLVQRVSLATDTIDLTFSLPGLNSPGSFLVVPGQPQALAAAFTVTNFGVAAIYDNDVPRPSQWVGSPFKLMGASSRNDSLFGYAHLSSSGSLPNVFRMQITPSGLTYVDSGPLGVPMLQQGDMASGKGRLYFGTGTVLNTEPWMEEAPFPLVLLYMEVEVNEEASLAMYLGGESSTKSHLSIYDLESRRPLSLQTISGLVYGVRSLTQCGADRLAFCSASNVFIVRNSIIPFAPPADLSLRGIVNDPSQTIGNPVEFFLTVSNAGPNVASNIQIRLPVPANAAAGPIIGAQGTISQPSPNSPELQYQLGHLGAGQLATISWTMTNFVPGTFSNQFLLHSASVDPDRSNNLLSLITTQSLPQLTISDLRILEGHSGFTNAVLTVTHNAQLAPPLSVSYTNSPRTAGLDDFVRTSGTLYFGPGTNSLQIVVPVRGDPYFEADEVFAVTLLNPSQATLATPQALVTIANDDGRMGELFTFAWSPVSDVAGIMSPFPAVITARDAANNVAVSFNGSATLKGIVPFELFNGDFDYGTLLDWYTLNLSGDPGPYQVVAFDTAGTGQISYAFRLTPNSGPPDGLLKYVRLRGGFTYRFELDAAQALEGGVSSNPGLTQVKIEAAGVPICAHDFAPRGSIAPNEVFRAHLAGDYFAPTNGLYSVRILITRPTAATASLWGIVDNLRIQAISLPAVEPATVNFVNGTWSGTLRFAGPADSMWLQADDLNGHTGISSEFAVVPPPQVGITAAAGAIRLSFQAEENRTYQIQFSTNLVNWVTISPSIQGFGASTEWTDPGPPTTPSAPRNSQSRFYRVRLIQ